MYTIGLVEDNETTAIIHTKQLKQLIDDVEIIRFSNGEDVLKFLESNNNGIDIFLLDFNLLGGLTGLSTALKIKQLFEIGKIKRDYPCIIYTATQLSFMKNEYEVATMSQIPFLQKPVKSEEWKKFIIKLSNELIKSKNKRNIEDNKTDIEDLKKCLIGYINSQDEFNVKLIKRIEEIKVISQKPLHEKVFDSFDYYKNSKDVKTRFLSKLFIKMFVLICLLMGIIYTSNTFDLLKLIKGK